MNETITIFTDGSSRGNPGRGGWAAIVAASGRVKELGGGEEHTTNNRMEITGVIEALTYIFSSDFADFSGENESRVVIHSDSSYVINGATKWLSGWQKKNWVNSQKEQVLNRDLWEKLALLLERLEARGVKIVWKQVEGHAGVDANERCDEVATGFADKIEVKLYDGLAVSYQVDLSVRKGGGTKGPEGKDAEKSLRKSRSRAQAHSYVSMVNGKIEVHATWAECERRVKGAKGAKYKKALTPEEEIGIISEFQAGK